MARAAAQSSIGPEDVNWVATADYEFGRTMRFQLSADVPDENADPIERATLFIRAPEFAQAFSATQSFEPTRQTAVAYDLDLAQVRLAPFTTVTYWWVLETAVDSITLPNQSIIYEDDQFEWRQVRQEGVTVHWTGEDVSLGQLTLDIVAESLPQLRQLIPADEALTLDFYLYPSSADLRAALRLTGRDWVGAHAHPELGVILTTAVNARTAATDLRQSIPHELVHFLLYRAVGLNYDHLPLWFNEGLATFVEPTPNPSYEALLETAVADQTTIPFAELCRSFPSDEQSALLAYAQSASLIQYIQARYGDQTLREFIAAFADGADCKSGVTRVLQMSLEDLNQDWLRRQQPRSPFIQFWLDNGLWLLLLIGGFGVAGLLLLAPGKNS